MKKFLFVLMLFVPTMVFAQLAPPKFSQHFVKEGYATAKSGGFYLCPLSVSQVRAASQPMNIVITNLSSSDTLFVGFRYAGSSNVDTAAPYLGRVFPQATKTFGRFPIDSVWVKGEGTSDAFYYSATPIFVR